MPKNAQGSWVGTQAQPVFQTYPTAGMLQPAAAPVQPVVPQTQPVPEVPPTTLPPDLLGQIGGLFTGNTEHPLPIVPTPEPISTDDPRTRLVNAVLGMTRKNARSGSTLGKF